ncbi:hypothetical protein PMAYCL1PPCAC_28194, partial [Pristionchus mayeri]
ALVVEEDGIEERRNERIHHYVIVVRLGHPRRQQHEDLALHVAHLANDRIREDVLSVLLHSLAHVLRVDTVYGEKGVVDARQLTRERHAYGLARGDVRLQDVDHVAKDLQILECLDVRLSLGDDLIPHRVRQRHQLLDQILLDARIGLRRDNRANGLVEHVHLGRRQIADDRGEIAEHLIHEWLTLAHLRDDEVSLALDGNLDEG